MYNNYLERQQMSRSPQPANNPFLESSAASRFPALDETQYQPSLQPSQPYVSQSIPQSHSQFQQFPYGMQQQQQQFNQWNQLQSPGGYNQGGGGYVGYGVASQPTGFGLPYGAQQQPQLQVQTQYTGYPQFQSNPVPQQYQQQNAISEFDPYSGLSLRSPSGLLTPTQTGQMAGQFQRLGPSGQQHPRAFVRSHKALLENWNSVSWKEALETFNSLRQAWETRRAELQNHLRTGQYLTSADITNINGMMKQSESNIDTIAASLLQMQEVSQGYKHSLDAVGKQRVREALNAGLQNLPDWP